MPDEKEAQTLCLLGSANQRDTQKLWVGLDCHLPVEISTETKPNHPWIEFASFVTEKDIADWDDTPDSDGRFGIELDSGHSFWIARFDFPDHEQLKG